MGIPAVIESIAIYSTYFALIIGTYRFVFREQQIEGHHVALTSWVKQLAEIDIRYVNDFLLSRLNRLFGWYLGVRDGQPLPAIYPNQLLRSIRITIIYLFAPIALYPLIVVSVMSNSVLYTLVSLGIVIVLIVLYCLSTSSRLGPIREMQRTVLLTILTIVAIIALPYVSELFISTLLVLELEAASTAVKFVSLYSIFTALIFMFLLCARSSPIFFLIPFVVSALILVSIIIVCGAIYINIALLIKSGVLLVGALMYLLSIFILFFPVKGKLSKIMLLFCMGLNAMIGIGVLYGIYISDDSSWMAIKNLYDWSAVASFSYQFFSIFFYLVVSNTIVDFATAHFGRHVFHKARPNSFGSLGWSFTKILAIGILGICFASLFLVLMATSMQVSLDGDVNYFFLQFSHVLYVPTTVLSFAIAGYAGLLAWTNLYAPVEATLALIAITSLTLPFFSGVLPSVVLASGFLFIVIVKVVFVPVVFLSQWLHSMLLVPEGKTVSFSGKARSTILLGIAIGIGAAIVLRLGSIVVSSF